MSEHTISLNKKANQINVPYTENGDKIIISGNANILDYLGGQGAKDALISYCQELHIPLIKDPIKVQIVDNSAQFPSKAHPSDIGYDLTIIKKVKDLTKTTSLYDTGIKMTAPAGCYLEIVPRSSISKSGYILANSMGIIDPSYNGNFLVALCKVDSSCPDLTLPATLTQVIVRPAYVTFLEQVHDITVTARSDGGFGSTNSK